MSSSAAIRQQAEDLYSQAVDLLAAGNPAEAALRFQAAIKLDPDFLDAHHGLIRALRDSGDYDRAIEVALALISLDPEDALAYTSLSILYQHKGMVPEAEAEALKAKLLGWKLELRESRQAGPVE